MIYRMWTKGDEKPEVRPEGCEYFDDNDASWGKSGDVPSKWGNEGSSITVRRWPAEPQEQRPTAFGLLSEEEQEELRKACEEGKIQVADSKLNWCDVLHPSWHIRGIYRIKPEPTYDFLVTMNGKPVNPKDISKETWMSFRGEG